MRIDLGQHGIQCAMAHPGAHLRQSGGDSLRATVKGTDEKAAANFSRRLWGLGEGRAFFPKPLCFESQVLAVAGGAWCRHNYSRPQWQYSTTEPRLDKTCSLIDWGHSETRIKHDPTLKCAQEAWMQFWDILLCKEDDIPSANQGCWSLLFSS